LLISVTSGVLLSKGSMRLGILVALGLVVGSVVAAQSNADYLKSLQGEAENVTLDKKTELETTRSKISASVSGPGQISNSLVSGLTVEQFEKVLQKNYMGSYLFYKRLSDSQRAEVYSFYQGNPDPDSVRDKILKVSKK
jgi:hypothetical protein